MQIHALVAGRFPLQVRVDTIDEIPDEAGNVSDVLVNEPLDFFHGGSLLVGIDRVGEVVQHIGQLRVVEVETSKVGMEMRVVAEVGGKHLVAAGKESERHVLVQPLVVVAGLLRHPQSHPDSDRLQVGDDHFRSDVVDRHPTDGRLEGIIHREAVRETGFGQ